MKLADKFKIPIIFFIDTPGAYTGVGAEERGQAEAIAKTIACSMELGVPTISVIIGEGGSGGAVALSSSSKVLMLSNAIYSVISPDGCATILWRDPTKTLDAAKAMKLSAKDLLNLGVIDEIIGMLNLSANLINLIVFLYPSGLIIPKFLSILDSKFSPFSCPITKTD